MTNYDDDFQFMVVQVTFCLIAVSSGFSHQDDDQIKSNSKWLSISFLIVSNRGFGEKLPSNIFFK
jgi:hypothetical protein